MIARLPTGPMIEKRARNIDHVRRVRALVEERCATASTEAARSVCRFVLVASDLVRALDDSEALASAPYIGGAGRAVRDPACSGVIMPSPARGNADFDNEPHRKGIGRSRYQTVRSLVCPSGLPSTSKTDEV
jgi:hypothetical protein